MAKPKAKTHLQKLVFLDTDKKNSKHDIIQIWVYENIEKIISDTIMKKNTHPFEIKDIRWEHQVMNINGRYTNVVGFIDIMVRFKSKFYFHDTDEYEDFTKQIFIEVKTEIPNLGALIRQMRTYQAYERNDTYYLIVAPDDKFKKLLNDQGFYFYKYEFPKDPTLLF